MAISVRSNIDEMVLALALAHNTQQSTVSGSFGAGDFHRDLTQTTSGPLLDLDGVVVTTVTVSAATAVDLPTTKVLANQMFGVLNLHMLDDQAHLIKDAVNLVVIDGYQTMLAVDLPSSIVLLNALKVVFNDHLVQTGVHQHNDATNTVATAAAHDLASCEALANAMKTAMNAHMASAPTGYPRIRLIGS